MDNSLKALYNWFDIQRASIINGHENERVLIADNKVLGYFADERSAVTAALAKGYDVGSFLVQRCISEEAELQMFYNVNLAGNYV